MATSSSTDFVVTESNIISDALAKLGVIAVGASPTAGETTHARRALNMMCKQWSSPSNGLVWGFKAWQREELALTLTAAISFEIYESASAALNDTAPIAILSAMLRDTNGNESPLSWMTIQEFQAIPNKSSTGTPQRYTYERLVLNSKGVLYLDIIPSDTTDVLDLLVLREIEDFDAANNNPDFPKEWSRALVWNLALELAEDYGKDPRRYENKAREAINLANSFNPQRYTGHFEPDREL